MQDICHSFREIAKCFVIRLLEWWNLCREVSFCTFNSYWFESCFTNQKVIAFDLYFYVIAQVGSRNLEHIVKLQLHPQIGPLDLLKLSGKSKVLGLVILFDLSKSSPAGTLYERTSVYVALLLK